MATIVCVHGIGQQVESSETLLAKWEPALRGGISNAGMSLPVGTTVACAFYGGLFRSPARHRSLKASHYRPTDVTEEESSFLQLLWWQAAKVEPDRVVAPDASVRTRTPRSVQSALQALLRSRFFTGVTRNALIGDLKQVRAYMEDEIVREAAQEAVDRCVTSDTRVLIGHSLGSVVAYEALYRYEESENWSNIQTLVTLGSPLGIPTLIFDRLKVCGVGEEGRWPRLIRQWTNVSDDYDVVALEKRLAPLFGDDLEDIRIDNDVRAHDSSSYLTASETGEAIMRGLSCD